MAVVHPLMAPGGGPCEEFPCAPQPLMLPVGIGSVLATPNTFSVVVDGSTFNEMFKVADPPPVEPVPPAEPVRRRCS